MSLHSNLKPDRPIAKWLTPIRRIVRIIRIIRCKCLIGKEIILPWTTVLGKALELRPPENIKIGKNVYIGPWFLTESNLEIGNDVLISSRVSCIGNDHAFDDPHKTIFTQGRIHSSTVILEGDNLLGFGTIIIGDVRIGRGCIVGAGSVVTKDLPQNMICAGVCETN